MGWEPGLCWVVPSLYRHVVDILAPPGANSFPNYANCAPVELYDSRDWNNKPIPPPRHWCYLGEIVEHITAPIRNVLEVRDKAGEDTHLSSNFDLKAQFDVKVGSTIAILYAEMKYFSFGIYGLRLDHAKFVKIFPCNLETLLRINDKVESEKLAGSPKKCEGCKAEEPNKTTLLRCSRCLGCLYCGKECQTAAWKRGHKRECKVFEAIIELKRSRDWGNKKPPGTGQLGMTGGTTVRIRRALRGFSRTSTLAPAGMKRTSGRKNARPPKDEDTERWERLGTYNGHNIFLVNAVNGAEALKLLARFISYPSLGPSKLETHLEDKKSSSLFASEATEAFGCNLAFIGDVSEWDFAQLIFGEEDSSVFPGEKELVGFRNGSHVCFEMDFVTGVDNRVRHSELISASIALSNARLQLNHSRGSMPQNSLNLCLLAPASCYTVKPATRKLPKRIQ
ncbi:hypothetical protein B0H14DRAFT_3127210 [Mycena olivaceomarginata]|nr:hypothetical protein B0H14DRAFT_3127210 [Mycena olivaceomarginata]